MAETVVGVFETHEAAVRGVEELRREGFAASQISIFAPDAREAEGFADDLGVRVVQAGAVGLATGGALGGLAGWLIGITGLLVPGAGLILAAGPIAGAIVGAIGGASVGGFIGMMVGLGLPEHAAEEYNRELQAGKTIVFVHPHGHYALAELALERARPLGLHRYEERIGSGSLEEELHRPPPPEPADPNGQVEAAAPEQDT